MIKKLAEIGSPAICPTIAIVRNKKILIGLRHYTPDKWKAISVWTLPGGRCDDGEKIEAALRREVTEEVGIDELEITNFLGEVKGAKSGDLVYLFTGISNQEPKLLEPEKFSKWCWQDIDLIPENFINPEALQILKDFISQNSML